MNQPTMNLDTAWSWEKRKILVRSESGNPGFDDLRERLAELAGVNLKDLLDDMKKDTAKKKSTTGKRTTTISAIGGGLGSTGDIPSDVMAVVTGQTPSSDYEATKKYKEILHRSHIVDASQAALGQHDAHSANNLPATVTAKNVKKKFFGAVPKSPPKRVALEIQREMAKPIIIPNPEETKAASIRLQRKLAKQRAARKSMAAGDGGDEVHVEPSSEENTPREPGDIREYMTLLTICIYDNLYAVDKMLDLLQRTWEHEHPISAEGELEGMLYLSRMADSVHRIMAAKKEAKAPGSDDYESAKQKQKDPASSEASVNKEANSTDPNSIDKKRDEEKGINGSSSSVLGGVGVDTYTSSDMDAKLYCAKALCNWTRNPTNAQRLAKEGAIRALMHLALEPIPKILFYCAGAFRFMSENLVLATTMIDESTIPVIADIIKAGINDDNVVGNLTITLVNLTRVNGREGQVVEAMIHQALTNILTSHPELSASCARGLYNLTCVDNSYLFIEKVVRALIQLAGGSTTTNVKHICAAALCNLADMKTVRLRLVEEGVISVLSILAKGSETRTRRICAVILQNLSQSKSCRVEMVSRSAVQAAHMLSADTDPIILRCIGLTISRLSSEPANSHRIIHELGIAALCNIAVKFPTIPGITQPIATSFQLLSIIQSARVAVVQEGSVAALAALLKNSSDVYTIQHCLLSLCNLLTEAENHLAIVQQGLIATLIYLTDNDNDTIRDYCALAFLNLSLSDESRKHAVNAGATIAIIELSKAMSPPMTKARCAAAIMNLATAPFRDVTFVTVVLTPVMERMVADGAIVALVDLISVDDIATVRYACAALCRLCVTPASGMMIMESGAIPTLVQRAIEGEPQTQQYCGAVLSSLSCYEACRVQLFEMNCVAALKKLAEIDDDVTKQRCLSAFANLSCEESIQLRLIDQKVVGIISDLADSYHETTYIYCARALCNLACAEGGRLRVATEGGMRALLMISMVRSVDVLTKYWCVVALCNLLDITSIDYMLTEGLVASTAKLSRNRSNDDTIHTCARIFNFLSSHAPARLRIIEKASTLHALYSMIDSSDNETRILAARTTSNLLFSAETRDKAIEAGALHTLQAGIVSGNEEASLHCLKALFSACKQQPLMPIIAKTSIPMALCKFASECLSIDRHDLAIKCLVLLAWNPESRESLIKRTFADAFMQLVVQNLQSSSLEHFALILRYLCVSYVRREELIAANVLSAISFVYHADPVLNPPPEQPVDPQEGPLTLEGGIDRLGEGSFAFVRPTGSSPSPPASRKRSAVQSASGSPKSTDEGQQRDGLRSADTGDRQGTPSSSRGDGSHGNGTKFTDRRGMPSSRTPSANGSRAGSRAGSVSGGGIGSDRHNSSSRASKLSNRATMDSKPSSRRPSFEKKAPTRASFDSKPYSLPIIQALTGLDPTISTIKNNNNNKCLAAAIRALATEPLCTETMASTDTIAMLKSIGDSCNREPTVIYDIAVALYQFASHSAVSRLATSSADTVAVLQVISNLPECTELCIVTICQYLTDPRSRKVFANREIIMIVLGVLETSRQNDVLFNGITSLYLLSQRADCIAILAEPALQSDMHVLRLSKSEDKKIQANCIRTLKNMSSDSSETIAEGAVASLLSMYFEDHILERFEEDQFKPKILPLSADDKRAPACIKEEIIDCLWYSEKVVISGGAAGKGPNPPEPPTTDMDENASDNHGTEEPDSADLDSRTKMCFAKMQTSQSLRDQCLLTDIDFITVRDGPDDDEWLHDDEDSAGEGLDGGSLSPQGSSRRSPHSSFAAGAGSGTLIVSRPNRSMMIEGGDGRGGGIIKYGQTSPLMSPISPSSGIRWEVAATAPLPAVPSEVSSDQPAVTTQRDEDKDKDKDKKEKPEDVSTARGRGMNISISTGNEGSNNSTAVHSQVNSPALSQSKSKPQSHSKTPKKLRNEIRSSSTHKRNTAMTGSFTTSVNGMMSPGGMTVSSDFDEPYNPIQQQLAALEGPKLTAPGSGYGKFTPSKRETMSTLSLYN